MRYVMQMRVDQKMDPACELILGQSSEASLATGPVMALPLVSPLLLTMTPALSSQQRKVPSGLRQARLCLMMTAGWTFFLSFWTPFLTEQSTTSPMDPAGNLLRLPLTPCTAMMKRFLAPELSAQLRVAATGRPRVILSLTPTAPVLVFLAIDQYIIQLINIPIATLSPCHIIKNASFGNFAYLNQTIHQIILMSTIKNKSLSQGKSKSRSLQRAPSPGLVEYLDKKYQKSIPISALTAAHKLYGRTKPLSKDDRFVQRFSDGKGNVDGAKLLEYLSKSEPQEKGKPLTAQAIGRVYQNFANHDGRLSFEYIMKMGESSGVQISAKVAKAIVRKYGQRKDHLDLEDCLRINERWHNRSLSKSPSKGKR